MIGRGREGVGKAAKGYACSDGRELLCLLVLYEKGTNRCRQRAERKVRRLRKGGHELDGPTEGNGKTNVGGRGKGEGR